MGCCNLPFENKIEDKSLQLEIANPKTKIFYKRPTKVGGNDAGVLL